MAQHDDSVLPVGRDLFNVPDLETALEDIQDGRFDFIIAPLAHPRYERDFLGSDFVRAEPFTRPDYVVSSQEWTTLVVGKISQWIDVDNADPKERRRSEHAFHQEMKWSCHLGVPGVVIRLTNFENTNLASALSGYLTPGNSQFWLSVPLVPMGLHIASPKEDDNEEENEGREHDTWEWWNRFRSLTPSSSRLGVALEITENLPSPSRLLRWHAEPVKALLIPTSVFLTNAKGFPVLSKAHQAFVLSMLGKFKLKVVITGTAHHEKGLAPYLRYLSHLYSIRPAKGPVAEAAIGYEDLLQSPLQPLMDNLESQTYETFEKDPFKYAQYQAAVEAALKDKAEMFSKTPAVIMVVGAGRGPLVSASLQAAENAKQRVNVYAIEKNPNAVVTLRAKNQKLWNNRVTIIACDMRNWEPDRKADILVSELLGSFGDNELSPECLDGAQRLLKEGGISVPYRYTSYLCPISTHKLHSELVSHNEKKHLHTPFVVMMNAARHLSDIQKCFVFEHPNKECETKAGPDNSRYIKLEFKIKDTGILHGFAGYFDSQLYKDLEMSIHPDTHSPGMFSWFPIYFPIETPFYVTANDVVTAYFWRKVSRTKVWYEWVATTKTQTSGIHNIAGDSYYIGL